MVGYKTSIENPEKRVGGGRIWPPFKSAHEVNNQNRETAQFSYNFETSGRTDCSDMT